jgi:hypothetical protein
MKKYPTVFTSGQVAKICRVSNRTVNKWFDAGLLKGYLVPGGIDRRIPVGDLRAFMLASGMPIEWLDGPGEPADVVRTVWGTVELAAPQGG